MNQYIRKPVAPPPDVKYAHQLGRGMLLPEQLQELVKAINPAYVEGKQGKNYLAQHQARAEMNRIFGYGNWDIVEDDPVLLYEEQRPGSGQNASKMYWIAGYRMKVTVDIRDLWGMPVATVTGTHAEENASLPNRGEAHAMALTSVSSYALRRALINLGDRFGLGLYNGGSKAPHGQYTIQLLPGILSTWEPTGQQQGVPTSPVPSAAPVQMPTHETIRAEQAVPEDQMWAHVSDDPSDYDDGSPEQAVAEQKRSRKVGRFTQAQASVQQGNMQARLQAGMKQDAAQEADRQRYEVENDYANQQAAQQQRGGVIE